MITEEMNYNVSNITFFQNSKKSHRTKGNMSFIFKLELIILVQIEIMSSQPTQSWLVSISRK